MVKNPPANGGDVREAGSIPGLGRSPGGGLGNPLQYSCLENPMDRGARWATVPRVAQSWPGLKQLSTHAKANVSMMETYYIINSQSKFASLFAETKKKKSRCQISCYSVLKENLKPVSTAWLHVVLRGRMKSRRISIYRRWACEKVNHFSWFLLSSKSQMEEV